MGWSCTMEAGRVMNRITEACYRQTKSQNVFVHNGQKYMWEGSGREQRDGSITGSVYKYLPSGHVSRAGSFKISADGKKVTGIGMAALAGASGNKPKVKKERLTLQKYRYHGFLSKDIRRGEIIYVDMQNKHPDPMGKLLWGYHKNGNLAHGDYEKAFEKVGKPVQFEFEQTGRYAADEKRVRHEKILKAIRSGMAG